MNIFEEPKIEVIGLSEEGILSTSAGNLREDELDVIKLPSLK